MWIFIAQLATATIDGLPLVKMAVLLPFDSVAVSPFRDELHEPALMAALEDICHRCKKLPWYRRTVAGLQLLRLKFSLSKLRLFYWSTSCFRRTSAK